jgi:hypothetical protein
MLRGVVVVYEVFCRVVELLALRGRRDRSKDVEIVVLRKQLEVLRRQVGRPRIEHRDRVALAALSRVLPRKRWAAFFVTPRHDPSLASPPRREALDLSAPTARTAPD